MLHILLAVLKIIGIILLVILGLILAILGLALLLCACILFVPIRYGAYISHTETSDITHSRIKVTFLLHMVSFLVYLKDKKPVTELRLFGFKLSGLKFKKKKKDQNDSQETAKEETTQDLFDEVDLKKQNSFRNRMKRKRLRKQRKKALAKKQKQAGKNGQKEDDEYLGLFETEKDQRDLDNVEAIESNFFRSDKTPQEDRSKIPTEKPAEQWLEESQSETFEEDNSKKNPFVRFKQKINAIIHKIRYQIQRICGKIKDVFEKTQSLREKVGRIKAMTEDEDNRLAFSFVKGEVFKLLRHMRPRRIKGYVRFGLADPADTGKVLGIIYAILRKQPKHLAIRPDFEHKVFETDMQIKGRIQLYYLLFIAYRVYKNDHFKKVFERRRNNGG